MKPTIQQKSRLSASIPAILLFALVLWTFLPAIQNDFVGYDDPEYVTGNPRVQEGLSAHTLNWAFGATAASNWHPLTWLSHMLDCQLFELRPAGHHLTSILLHALNASLLFVVLRQMTGAVVRSFIVSALFGLHPLRVESVAWISERKDVLSGLFFLLTIWAYVRYAQSVGGQVSGGKSELRNPKSETSPQSETQNRGHIFTFHVSHFTFETWGFYGLSLAFLAFGLMSKPMLVTTPFVLLLLDYWPLRRWPEGWRAKEPQDQQRGQGCPRSSLLLIEKVPFVLLAIAASIVTYLVQSRAGAVVSHVPFIIRLENSVLSYGRYLMKLLWPSNLAAFYPFPSHIDFVVVISIAVLLVLTTAVALRLRTSSPSLIMGWLWYVGMLVPVIGIVQAGDQAMADRYSYLASIGILIAAIWGIYELVKQLPAFKQPALICALVASIACVAATRRQITVWKNTETLFTHAIQVTQNNYLAHNDLGAAYEKQGRLDEAKIELLEAIRKKPDYAEACDNLGVVLQKQGQLQEAITCYSNALTFVPHFAPAHNHLGLALVARGRLDEAIEHYRQAIKRRPEYADAHFNLAVALARKGQTSEAIQEYRRVLEIEPGSADAHNNLGAIFDRNGDLTGAVKEYESAVRLKPDYARAHLNLGMALAKTGRVQDAISEVQEAVRLKPDFVEARQALDALIAMQKKK